MPFGHDNMLRTRCFHTGGVNANDIPRETDDAFTNDPLGVLGRGNCDEVTSGDAVGTKEVEEPVFDDIFAAISEGWPHRGSAHLSIEIRGCFMCRKNTGIDGRREVRRRIP